MKPGAGPVPRGGGSEGPALAPVHIPREGKATGEAEHGKGIKRIRDASSW